MANDILDTNADMEKFVADLRLTYGDLFEHHSRGLFCQLSASLARLGLPPASRPGQLRLTRPGDRRSNQIVILDRCGLRV